MKKNTSYKLEKTTKEKNIISDNVFIAKAMLDCVNLNEAELENIERIDIAISKLSVAKESLYKLKAGV